MLRWAKKVITAYILSSSSRMNNNLPVWTSGCQQHAIRRVRCIVYHLTFLFKLVFCDVTKGADASSRFVTILSTRLYQAFSKFKGCRDFKRKKWTHNEHMTFHIWIYWNSENRFSPFDGGDAFKRGPLKEIRQCALFLAHPLWWSPTQRSPQEGSCSAQKHNCCDKYHIPRLSDLVRCCLNKTHGAACHLHHLTTLPPSAKPASAEIGSLLFSWQQGFMKNMHNI